MTIVNTKVNTKVSTLTKLVQQGSKLNLIPEYKTVLEAMTTEPSITDKKLQNLWLKQMVDGGYYAKAEFLDMFSVHAEDSALFNWKNPSELIPTKIGTPVFTAHKGFKGDSINGSCLDLKFTALTMSTVSSNENFCAIVGVGDNVQENARDFGVIDPNNTDISISSRWSDDYAYYGSNTSSRDYLLNSNSIAHYAMSRANSSNVDIYKNLTKTSKTRSVIAALSSRSLYACGRNNNRVAEPNNKTIRYVFFFSYLTEMEVFDVINITENYLQAVNSGLFFLDEYDLNTIYNEETNYG